MFTVVRDLGNGCMFGSNDSGGVFFHYGTQYGDVMFENGFRVQYDNSYYNTDKFDVSIQTPVLNSFYTTSDKSVNLKYNGTSVGSGNNGNYNSWNSFVINGRTNGETTQGIIHEVIVFNRVVTSAEVIEIEGYLATKWGLQALLPAGHKYSTMSYSYTTLGNSGMNNYSGGGGGGGGGAGPACFLGRAPVQTPSGYSRIDSLKVGDLVLTETGKAVPVRRIVAKRYRPGPSTNPYVLPKGQFGATEELLISPRHRIAMADGEMVEARDLGLAQHEMKGPFTYYNIELPAWSNMRVAGVEVESMVPAKGYLLSQEQFEAALTGIAITEETLKALRRTCSKDGNGKVMVLGGPLYR